MTVSKALTVRQPYASLLLADDGKDVENRTGGTSHRGPIAIHAGLVFCAESVDDHAVRDHLGYPPRPEDYDGTYGLILGVVDLVDVHEATGRCCAPWGWPHAWGRPDRPLRHLVRARPRWLPEPIPTRGQLGLWSLSHDLAVAVNAALAVLAPP